MAEYIERNAAKKELADSGLIPRYMENNRPVTDRIIDRIQAADVAPVRHGRWLNANSRPKTYERRCTACGGKAYFCGIGCSYKYCPNCGARMDAEENLLLELTESKNA